MKCPMCNTDIPENSEYCNSCGCKILYNGKMPIEKTSIDLSPKDKTRNKKAIILLVIVIIVLLIALVSSLSRNKNNSNYQEENAHSYSYYSGYEEVKDWMKDQASGQEYNYDDGGEYYCMGKNDTCPNKTNNKYDLYCNSCDPDGDNIEG